MIAAGHLSGGASLLKKLKMGAAIVDPGIILIGGAGTSLGVIPCTATSFASAFGLAQDEATYSSTQGATEGVVTVNVRPDQIIKARMSGTAADGGALVSHTNTSASAGGTVLTAAIGTHDIDGGLMWCVSGNNVGLSRSITAYSSNASATVTVPFPRAIAVGDVFHIIPWNMAGTGADGADGCGFVSTTTLFTEADSIRASGTGGEVSVVDLELNGSLNSYVLFKLRMHVHDSDAQAA